VFRSISWLFEATKTRSGLNVIKTVIFVDENRNEGNALQEFVGPRPNLENKIQNAQHGSQGKMARITAVCFLPLACSLHFTLSLQDTLGLQSAVCSLQSAFYTDRL